MKFEKSKFVCNCGNDSFEITEVNGDFAVRCSRCKAKVPVIEGSGNEKEIANASRELDEFSKSMENTFKLFKEVAVLKAKLDGIKDVLANLDVLVKTREVDEDIVRSRVMKNATGVASAISSNLPAGFTVNDPAFQYKGKRLIYTIPLCDKFNDEKLGQVLVECTSDSLVKVAVDYKDMDMKHFTVYSSNRVIDIIHYIEQCISNN